MRKAIRCGAWVRYVGDDALLKDLWGDRKYKVIRKSGGLVVGLFPCRYADGSIHLMNYFVRLKDVVIAN